MNIRNLPQMTSDANDRSRFKNLMNNSSPFIKY
jgi:hypothetical protein